MKATRKNYLEVYALRNEARDMAEDARSRGDWEMKLKCEAVMVDAESYINKYFTTVPVKYWCGYRQFFEEVVKIGNTYFQYGKAMTKGRGYRSIEEIPEITEKMNAQMLDDMYYY